MRPIIEFCATSLASGTQKALEILDKDPNLDVIEYGCLSFCGKCAASPFVLVNGEVVTGETNEDLIKKIYAFIEENLVF